MFSKCPRCGSFRSRFDFKRPFPFSIFVLDHTLERGFMKFAEEKGLTQWGDNGVCGSCRLELRIAGRAFKEGHQWAEVIILAYEAGKKAGQDGSCEKTPMEELE